ncbi:MAG: hypothetical protein K0R38_5094 [Polyangiaceae bacterium]|nr:hypothetical protein [Polyangiaceae bacterium]
MRLAMLDGMASRRAQSAAIAAGSDGSVMINLVELLTEDMRARLTKQLGSPALFVGVPLSEKEAVEVVSRLDGAAAEASAKLIGARTKSRAKPLAKRR